MRRVINIILYCKVVLIMSILFLCFQASSYAADVTLGWDANTEPDLASYKVYYKTGSSGEPYDGTGADQGSSPITVPIGDLADSDNPEYMLTGLTDGVTYFFVVTAYDTEGLESDYSNEVATSSEPTPAGDDGGGCFITTALFDSNIDKRVKILSEFRDKLLANNHLGKRFVTLYNRFSTLIADYSRRHLLQGLR